MAASCACLPVSKILYLSCRLPIFLIVGQFFHQLISTIHQLRGNCEYHSWCQPYLVLWLKYVFTASKVGKTVPSPPHSTPLGRVCGAYGVSRVTCYAQSPDMKIGLTGLASKIGVYSHEQGSRKRGVQLSNSAFMACCHHHRHHRYRRQQCIDIVMVIIFVTVGGENKEVVPWLEVIIVPVFVFSKFANVQCETRAEISVKAEI